MRFTLLVISSWIAWSCCSRITTKVGKYSYDNIQNGTDVQLNFDSIIFDDTNSYASGLVKLRASGVYRIGVTVSWTEMGMPVTCQVKVKDMSSNILASNIQPMQVGKPLTQTLELTSWLNPGYITFWISHNAPTTILVPNSNTPVMAWVELQY